MTKQPLDVATAKTQPRSAPFQVGQRMLGTVTRYVIGQFFSALEWRIAPQRATGWRGWLARLSGRGSGGDTP